MLYRRQLPEQMARRQRAHFPRGYRNRKRCPARRQEVVEVVEVVVAAVAEEAGVEAAAVGLRLRAVVAERTQPEAGHRQVAQAARLRPLLVPPKLNHLPSAGFHQLTPTPMHWRHGAGSAGKPSHPGRLDWQSRYARPARRLPTRPTDSSGSPSPGLSLLRLGRCPSEHSTTGKPLQRALWESH